MSNLFHDWLGLNEQITRPNYYQLLQLPLYEADPATIKAAADRAATRVQSHRPGDRAQQCAKLLEDIQAVKQCLLDPQQKAKYDRRLRRKLAEQTRASSSPESDQPVRSDLAATRATVNELTQSGTPLPQHPEAAIDPMAPVAIPQERSAPERSTPGDSSGDAPVDPMAPVSVETTAAAEPGPPQAMRSQPDLPQIPIPQIPIPQIAIPQIPAQLQPGSTEFEAPVAVSTDVQAGSAVVPAVSTNRTTIQMAAARRRRARNSYWIAAAGFSFVGLLGAVVYIAISRDGQTETVTGPAAPAIEQPQQGAKTRGQAQRSSPSAEVQNLAVVDQTARTFDFLSGPAEDEQSSWESAQPDEPLQPVVTASASASMATVDQVARAESVAAGENPTAEQVKQLNETLRQATEGLRQRQLDRADQLLDAADQIPMSADGRERFERLKLIASYVRQFWDAVDHSREQLTAGDEIQLSETTILGVVESRPDLLVIRAAGTNVRKKPLEISTRLAVALADRVLDQSEPSGKVITGSALAVARVDDWRPEARARWEEAKIMGANVDSLLGFLADQ